MNSTSSQTAKSAGTGLRLLPIAVAGLFFFVVLSSAGIGFSLSSQNVVKTAEAILERQAAHAAGTSSIFDQLKWLFLGGIGLYFHMRNNDHALATWTKALPLLILLFLCLVSVLWSSTPDIAVRRIIKHLLLIAAVAGVVVGASSDREVHRLALFCTGVIMAMNIASIFLFPGVARDTSGALVGLHGHKNGAGIFAMITVFVWLSAGLWAPDVLRRSMLLTGAVLAFLFLIGTNSRTSIACTIFSISFIIPLKYFIKSQMAAIIAVILAIFISLILVFALTILQFSLVDLVAVLEGERTTLSGRALLWQVVYKAFLNNVMLGSGYGSLWQTGGPTPIEMYGNLPLNRFLLGVNQAHNGYLDVLAALGLIGAVSFLVFLASAIVSAINALASTGERQIDPALATLCSLVILGALTHNLAESTFLRSGVLWAFLVLCYLLLCSALSRHSHQTP